MNSKKWPIIGWRVAAIPLLPLMCGLLIPVHLPKAAISNSAGQDRLAVSVNFHYPTPTASSAPDTATEKQVEKSLAQADIAPQPKPDTAEKQASKEKRASEKTPANSETPAPHKQDTASQEASRGNQGVHERPVITEPMFAAPPKAPRYPTMARKRGQEGVVWLDIWLDEEGRQERLEVTQSSGLATLDKSALKAVARWQFKPYEINGVRMASRIKLPIEFNLN